MSKTEFAGMLRERIRIERPVDQRDAFGSAATSTDLVGEYWAAIEAVEPGDESLSQSRSSLQRWRFTTPWVDAILPGDTLIWRDRAMIIRMVSEDRRLLPRTILLAEEKR